MLKQTVDATDATVELSVEQFLKVFPRNYGGSPHIAYVESKDAANFIAWDNAAYYTVVGDDMYFVLLSRKAVDIARYIGLEVIEPEDPFCAVAETLPPDLDLF